MGWCSMTEQEKHCLCSLCRCLACTLVEADEHLEMADIQGAMKIRNWHGQLFRYVVVGVAATATHVLVASVALLVFGQTLLLSNIMAFFIAWFVSYFGNALWSFDSQAKLGSMARFVVVSGINLAIIYVVSEKITASSLPEYTGILILSVLLPLVGFLLHKLWVFGK